MNRIAKASIKERSNLFIDVSNKLNLQTSVIEKDFWVSWVLSKIFENSELSQALCFKGGTSLSKGFGIIERFSEDIDLILNQELVLKEGEEIYQISKTKQSKFNEEINKRAQEYISSTLKAQITQVLHPVCTVKSDETDKHVLWVVTPDQSRDKYIRSEIKLEIGPLALWNPNEKTLLTSFVGKALPELKLKEPSVSTIKPERTFWEKITILHLEHYRAMNKTIAERYSRHYYDVYKLANSYVKEKAYNQPQLLKEVVEFKARFYPCSWAKYDEAQVGTIRLLPAEHSKHVLVQDYVQMRSMIYGDYPSWEQIIGLLKKLENEINHLDI